MTNLKEVTKVNRERNKLVIGIGTLAGILLLLGAFLVVWLVPRGPEATTAETQTTGQTSTKSGNAPAGSVNSVNTAQEGMVNGSSVSDQPHISVRGTGIVNAKPDMANLQVGVSIQKTSLQEAQNEATTKMNAVTEQLKAAGVADKDIATSQYNVEPVMNYQDNKPPEVTGFRVTNIVNVKVRDLSKAGKLIDDLVQSGANTIYGLSFGFSDTSALMKQAREAAVNDAKDKAGQLASLSGVTLGGPLAIEDMGANVPPTARDAMASKAPPMSGAAAMPVNPGEQEIRVDLNIVYGIK